MTVDVGRVGGLSAGGGGAVDGSCPDSPSSAGKGRGEFAETVEVEGERLDGEWRRGWKDSESDE